MGETFTTTTFKNAPKTTDMKGSETAENLEADDLIFYNSLRADLDILKKNPNPQTIHNILNYSKSSR